MAKAKLKDLGPPEQNGPTPQVSPQPVKCLVAPTGTDWLEVHVFKAGDGFFVTHHRLVEVDKQFTKHRSVLSHQIPVLRALLDEAYSYVLSRIRE